jgi:hypothetical protein
VRLLSQPRGHPARSPVEAVLDISPLPVPAGRFARSAGTQPAILNLRHVEWFADHTRLEPLLVDGIRVAMLNGNTSRAATISRTRCTDELGRASTSSRSCRRAMRAKQISAVIPAASMKVTSARSRVMTPRPLLTISLLALASVAHPLTSRAPRSVVRPREAHVTDRIGLALSWSVGSASRASIVIRQSMEPQEFICLASRITSQRYSRHCQTYRLFRFYRTRATICRPQAQRPYSRLNA